MLIMEYSRWKERASKTEESDIILEIAERIRDVLFSEGECMDGECTVVAPSRPEFVLKYGKNALNWNKLPNHQKP